MITDLINNYKKDEKDSNKNISENSNININKSINNDDKNETNKNIENIYEGYYIDNNEFINSINNKFNKINKFYKYQKSFNEIKNILKEDEEKIKKDIGHKKYTSSIDLQTGKSLENLIYNNSSVNDNNDHVLQSALSLPSKYVSNLMEKENFFKIFNNEEYYNGIEDYKDQLNRESYLMLNKNN